MEPDRKSATPAALLFREREKSFPKGFVPGRMEPCFHVLRGFSIALTREVQFTISPTGREMTGWNEREMPGRSERELTGRRLFSGAL